MYIMCKIEDLHRQGVLGLDGHAPGQGQAGGRPQLGQGGGEHGHPGGGGVLKVNFIHFRLNFSTRSVLFFPINFVYIDLDDSGTQASTRITVQRGRNVILVWKEHGF